MIRQSGMALPKTSLPDAPVDHLFALDQIETDVFRPRVQRCVEQLHPKVMFGGLIFAQAIAAAEKTLAERFRPHAVQSAFFRRVDPDRPVEYRVQRVLDGRSFCNRTVSCFQGGKAAFTAQMSFHVKEGSLLEHQIPMPKVPRPEQSHDVHQAIAELRQEIAEGKRENGPNILDDSRRIGCERPDSIFEFRIAEREKYFGLDFHRNEPIHLWLKLRSPPPSLDCRLRRFETRSLYQRDYCRSYSYLCAFVTDTFIGAAATRPHHQKGYRRTLAVTLNHSVWFHNELPEPTGWLMYENLSTSAAGSRAFMEGRLWGEDGRLLLTVNQEMLIRDGMPEAHL